MLYVNDQDRAAEFWTKKIGFQVISEEDGEEDMRWIEIAPTKEAQTSIILHNKEVVARMSPEVNLGSPSLMFFSDNLEQLYQDFKDKNVVVGELVTLPFGKVFNFADEEDNYFAVMENNS
jgi:lactoylglutathione lyase